MPKSKKFVKAQKCMLSEKNSSTFKYISDLFQYCTGKEQKFQIFQYIQVHIFFSSTFKYGWPPWEGKSNVSSHMKTRRVMISLSTSQVSAVLRNRPILFLMGRFKKKYDSKKRPAQPT